MKKDAVFDTDVAKGKTRHVRARTFTLPDVQPGDIIENQWTQGETDSASNYLRLPLQLSGAASFNGAAGPRGRWPLCARCRGPWRRFGIRDPAGL